MEEKVGVNKLNARVTLYKCNFWKEGVVIHTEKCNNSVIQVYIFYSRIFLCTRDELELIGLYEIQYVSYSTGPTSIIQLSQSTFF